MGVVTLKRGVVMLERGVAAHSCVCCSGGNKRKLSTAIALVGNPPIVMLVSNLSMLMHVITCASHADHVTPITHTHTHTHTGRAHHWHGPRHPALPVGRPDQHHSRRTQHHPHLPQVRLEAKSLIRGSIGGQPPFIYRFNWLIRDSISLL